MSRATPLSSIGHALLHALLHWVWFSLAGIYNPPPLPPPPPPEALLPGLGRNFLSRRLLDAASEPEALAVLGVDGQVR